MWKKIALCLFSLLFMLGTNFRLCCRAAVGGRQLEGLFSPFDIDRCETAAAAAAEEIVQGPALLPRVERSLSLSLSPPGGDMLELTDTALRSVTGVKLVDGVFVNGVYLGSVEDGDRLFEGLRGFIDRQMPTAAVAGNISGELEIRRIYSRSNSFTPDRDMLLLISGMAPVIYVDESGKLV